MSIGLSMKKFFGRGGTERTVTGTMALTAASARVQALQAESEGQAVQLPDARTLATGGPLYYLVSVSETCANAIAVRDGAGANLFTLEHGKAATLTLLDNSSPAGLWVWRISDAQRADA